jgi:ABC-type nitrate/sulfonate/bicarbonate transport system substrate-binding protein
VVKVPLSEWTAVAEQKSWLQQEFAKYGATVQMIDVNPINGTAGIEASLLDRGDLHFAVRMQYPALQHKLNGLDAVVVWEADKVSVRQNTIVVLNDSPINNVSDLKGKKLGSWRLSCPYASAYEIFKRAGYPLDTDYKKGEVRFVNVTGPLAVQSLLSGRIDALSVHPAAAVWTPLFTKGLIKEIAKNQPDSVYVSGGGRVCYIAMRMFANQHPELVKAFLEVRAKTVAWINAHPDEASVIIARENRVSKQVAKFGIVDSSAYQYFRGEPNADVIVNAIAGFQRWGIENGDDFLIRKHLSYEQINAFVDRRFFKGGQYSIY